MATSKSAGNTIKWDSDEFEMELIKLIAARFAKLNEDGKIEYGYRTLLMDLDACNSNGTPMDFEKLLAAPEFDFMHDILGIRRHMDRETGKLKDFFLPRCTARKAVKK